MIDAFKYYGRMDVTSCIIHAVINIHLLMETGVFFCLTRILSVRLILVGSCFTKNIYRET